MVKKQACGLQICLSCSRWTSFCISDKGWWTPTCSSWCPSKTKYGPDSTCSFNLEYTLLDNRCGFKLSGRTSYKPLFNFLRGYNLHDNDLEVYKSKEYRTINDNVNLYLVRKENIRRSSKDWIRLDSIGLVEEYINKTFAIRKLRHGYKV